MRTNAFSFLCFLENRFVKTKFVFVSRETFWFVAKQFKN